MLQFSIVPHVKSAVLTQDALHFSYLYLELLIIDLHRCQGVGRTATVINSLGPQVDF